MISLFKGKKEWLFGGVGGGGRGGVWQQICGYNLQILHQKSNYFTIYECKNVMDVSPNSIEHVQITCIFNCLTDYYFNN